MEGGRCCRCGCCALCLAPCARHSAPRPTTPATAWRMRARVPAEAASHAPRPRQAHARTRLAPFLLTPHFRLRALDFWPCTAARPWLGPPLFCCAFLFYSEPVFVRKKEEKKGKVLHWCLLARARIRVTVRDPRRGPTFKNRKRPIDEREAMEKRKKKRGTQAMEGACTRDRRPNNQRRGGGGGNARRSIVGKTHAARTSRRCARRSPPP